MTMVEARDLEKAYEAGGAHVCALRGLDLSTPRGEMVAVMGPSGCALPSRGQPGGRRTLCQ
jgi:ABC-type lipoprotein export system ATPase subunit